MDGPPKPRGLHREIHKAAKQLKNKPSQLADMLYEEQRINQLLHEQERRERKEEQTKLLSECSERIFPAFLEFIGRQPGHGGRFYRTHTEQLIRLHESCLRLESFEDLEKELLVKSQQAIGPRFTFESVHFDLNANGQSWRWKLAPEEPSLKNKFF